VAGASHGRDAAVGSEAPPAPRASAGPHDVADQAAASTQLQDLALALSGAPTPAEVLDALADLGRPALGADSIDISVLDESGQVLRLLTSRRSSPQTRIRFATYRADDPYPSRDALRTRAPVLIQSVQERDERWPMLRGTQAERASWMVLPLLAEGVPLGTVGLGWLRPQSFDGQQVRLCQQVTDLAAAALARAQRFDAEHEARAAAEDLAHRLAVLQALTGELAQATDLATVGDLVVHAGLRALEADAATIGVIEETDQLTILSTLGLEPDVIPRWSTHDIRGSAVARDVLSNGEPVVITSVADRNTRYPDDVTTEASFEASATLPLLVDGRPVGLVAYGWRDPHIFDGPDLEYLTAIAFHAAAAIDRSRLLAARERTAETLQRALLPQVITELAGWDLATCYIPAVEGTQVGGDWYDAFRSRDGLIVLALGDVAGKGVRAAAVMGAVRSALRAFAIVDATPATILTRLDAYFAAFKPEEMVTCTVAVLDPGNGDLTYANAGHLPPLVVHPSHHATTASAHGRVRWLDSATTPPLGANIPRGLDKPGAREQAHAAIAPGEALLLYTDGLVERRDCSLQDCLDDLAAASAGVPAVPNLTDAISQLTTTLRTPASVVDDIAVLALRRHANPDTLEWSDSVGVHDD
jgi:serine phosphatase RsbU (regulator of sigma subunit)